MSVLSGIMNPGIDKDRELLTATDNAPAKEAEVDEINEYLEKVKKGDSAAFSKVYDRFSRMVISVLRKVGRCPSAELDFHVNEVFFRIYKGIFAFKGNSRFSTYVYRIALNYSFHLTKKLKKEEFFHGEMEEDVRDTKLHFEKKIVDSVFMEKVLNSLSINLRTVVVLFYFDELSVKDIAEIENISENAVKNRLFQARDKIRTYLGEIGYEGI